jgi:hypothetical protein
MSPLIKCALAISFIVPATAAFASPPPPPPPPDCSVVTFNVTTVSCLGFFEGNLVAESGPKLTEALGYVNILDSDALSLLSKIDVSANPIDFGTPLSGYTVVGLHFGGGNTGYNGTAFWLLDITGSINTISYTSSVEKGLSNGGLYLTGGGTPTQYGAVPEPSTWAMMLLGFGGIGVALRRRRRTSGAPDWLRAQT